MVLNVIKIFLVGWIVLITAILLNIITMRLGITGWYQFFESVEKTGLIRAFNNLSPVPMLYMFIIYPFLLGVVGYFTFKALIK